METIRLYDADGYATDFEARVISCEKGKDGKSCLVLDQTLFFPEEGGQSCDKGQINGSPVLDVQKKNGVIYHTVADVFETGSTVRGEIDWEHRFSNMQQHSGEHIFSGTVKRLYGFNNVGFHLSDQIVTMDFDAPLSEQQLETVEWEANRAVTQNIEVQISYPTAEELAALDYRSKIEIEGPVRIVTVPGYDVCACCAPHVRRTGEIGLIKIMSVQNHKGGVRVSMLCGFRALQAFREKNRTIAALTNSLSTNQEALPGQAEKMKQSIYLLKNQLAQAKQELLLRKLEEIPETEENVLIFETGLETAIMRNGVNELVKKHTGICGIFSAKEEGGYHFIIGSSSRDCREVAASMKKELSAKGGGSSAMIQGSVEAKEEEVKNFLKRG